MRASLWAVVALLLPLCALHAFALSATISSPANGSILSGDETVSVAFSGTVNVTLEHNGTGSFALLDASQASGGYSFAWHTGNGSYPDGAYGLRITLVDAADPSDNATLLVNGLRIDNTPPAVSAFQVSDNHPASAGTEITLSVQASDPSGVTLVQLSNGSSSVLMTRVSGTALSGTYNVTMNLSVLGCGPDALCTVTVRASDAEGNVNESVTSEDLARPLYIDASAPVLLANATNASGALPGERVLVSARWDDVSLLDQEGFSVAFEAMEGNASSFSSSSQFSSWTNGQLSGNSTNATYTVNGSQEGAALALRVRFTDANGRAASTANLSLAVADVAPLITVRAPANGSIITNASRIVIEMLDQGIGIDLSALRVNLTSSAANSSINYTSNASLFDCACPECGSSYNSTTAIGNVTCAMQAGWMPQGNVTLAIAAADLRGNANATSMAYLRIGAPDIANVTLNGALIAASTPTAVVTAAISDSSAQAWLNWTVDAGTAIGTTSVSFLDADDPSASTLFSVPASRLLLLPAGKSYLRINATLNGSSLTDEARIDLTADVPIDLSALGAQYATGMVTSWRVREGSVDVTSQTRGVNGTFDVLVDVENTTHALPFQATLTYSDLPGLALRWNASQSAFAMEMANSSETAALGDLAWGDVVLALDQAGRMEWFLDGTNRQLIAQVNVSLANRSAYYQDADGALHLLRACAGAPVSAVDASGACAISSGADTTLFLPSLSRGDRIAIVAPDARGPNVSIHTPSSILQSVIRLNFSAASPDLASCAYDVGKWNSSNATSIHVAAGDVALSALTLDGARWSYSASITNATDGAYNLTVTCVDEQGESASAHHSVTVSDTTAPTISDVDEHSVGSSGATITGTADELVRFSVRYGTSDDELDTTEEEDGPFALSASIELTGLVSGETYYYNLTGCDAKSRCGTSATGFFTTSRQPSGGGGGGGGGGSGGGAQAPVSQSARAAHVWFEIGAGDTLEYAPKDMAVSLVRLRFSTGAERVEMEIAEHAQRPDGLAVELDRDIYRYLEIGHQGLTANVASYGLEFSIEKRWMDENLVDPSTIALYRLEGDEWARYPARRVGEDAKTYTYAAQPPGFSWFAIAGEAQPPAGEPVPEEMPEMPSQEQPSLVEVEEDDGGSGFVSALSRGARTGIPWIALALAGLLLASGVSVGGLKAYRIVQERRTRHDATVAREREQFTTRKSSNPVAAAAVAAVAHRAPEHDPMAQLHSYIARMRGHGHADERIRAHLLDAGWDSVIVDQEMERQA